MLFDLQSGKRRRVVQIVFGGLAVIFAVSFVFFGIGSDTGGGIADILGSGGGDAGEAFEDEINDAEDRLAANPNDTAALADLVTVYYQSGTNQLEIDETTGQTTMTPEAEADLEKAADAWARYLKLSKAKVDSSTASIAVQTCATLGQAQLTQASGGSGQAALDDADDAIANFRCAGEAQVISAEGGSSAQSVQAAEFLFFAGDTAAAEAAVQRALASASAKERNQVEARIETARKQGEQLNQQIEAFRKQLAKAGAGAGAGDNPLGDIGGGALGGAQTGGGALATP